MGLPPFGLFVSEFLLFRAGFQSGQAWTAAIALLLVGVGFVAIASRLPGMLHGSPPDDGRARGNAGRGCWRPSSSAWLHFSRLAWRCRPRSAD